MRQNLPLEPQERQVAAIEGCLRTSGIGRHQPTAVGARDSDESAGRLLHQQPTAEHSLLPDGRAGVSGDLARFSSKNVENSGKWGDWGDPREKRDAPKPLKNQYFARDRIHIVNIRLLFSI